MIIKEKFIEYGGFDIYLDSHEDYDLWQRIISLGCKGELISEPLFHYRRSNQGRVSSVNKKFTQTEILTQLQYRNPLLYSLPLYHHQPQYEKLKLSNNFTSFDIVCNYYEEIVHSSFPIAEISCDRPMMIERIDHGSPISHFVFPFNEKYFGEELGRKKHLIYFIPNLNVYINHFNRLQKNNKNNNNNNNNNNSDNININNNLKNNNNDINNNNINNNLNNNLNKNFLNENCDEEDFFIEEEKLFLEKLKSKNYYLILIVEKAPNNDFFKSFNYQKLNFLSHFDEVFYLSHIINYDNYLLTANNNNNNNNKNNKINNVNINNKNNNKNNQKINYKNKYYENVMDFLELLFISKKVDLIVSRESLIAYEYLHFISEKFPEIRLYQKFFEIITNNFEEYFYSIISNQHNIGKRFFLNQMVQSNFFDYIENFVDINNINNKNKNKNNNNNNNDNKNISNNNNNNNNNNNDKTIMNQKTKNFDKNLISLYQLISEHSKLMSVHKGGADCHFGEILLKEIENFAKNNFSLDEQTHFYFYQYLTCYLFLDY